MPAFGRIPVTDIASDDGAFVVTYRPQMQRLLDSVARMGVLTPLHLRRPAESAPLQLVAGSKRLRAAKQAGQATVPALVHEAGELSEQQAFLLAVHDNLACRPFNAVEKAHILRRLRYDFQYPDAALTEQFCPLLDLPPRPDTLRAYCNPGNPGRRPASGNGRKRLAHCRRRVGRRPGHRRPTGRAAPLRRPATRQQSRPGMRRVYRRGVPARRLQRGRAVRAARHTRPARRPAALRPAETRGRASHPAPGPATPNSAPTNSTTGKPSAACGYRPPLHCARRRTLKIASIRSRSASASARNCATLPSASSTPPIRMPWTNCLVCSLLQTSTAAM